MAAVGKKNSQRQELQYLLRPVLWALLRQGGAGLLISLILIYALTREVSALSIFAQDWTVTISKGRFLIATLVLSVMAIGCLVLLTWRALTVQTSINRDLFLFLFRRPYLFDNNLDRRLMLSGGKAKPEPWLADPQQAVDGIVAPVRSKDGVKIGLWLGSFLIIIGLSGSLTLFAGLCLWLTLLLAGFRLFLEVRKQHRESETIHATRAQTQRLLTGRPPLFTQTPLIKNFEKNFRRALAWQDTQAVRIVHLCRFFQILLCLAVLIIAFAMLGRQDMSADLIFTGPALRTIVLVALIAGLTGWAIAGLPRVLSGWQIASHLLARIGTAASPSAWSGTDQRTLIAKDLGVGGQLIDLNFSVTSGQILGIAGSDNESVRLLLVQLATGAFAYTGRMSYDGIELSSWDRIIYQSQVGFYDLQTPLPPATLQELVCQFGARVEQERFNQALTLSGLDKMTGPLPLSMVVDSHSSLLPAGLIARIKLASLVYQRPRLVVMEDPTAALDVTGIHAVKVILSHFKQSAIPVIIASRSRSLLKLCDTIVMLQRGRVSFSGVFTDLPNRFS